MVASANTPKKLINQTLASANTIAESGIETLRQFDIAVKQKLMSETTKLGVKQGEVQAGFKTLNVAVDDVVDDVKLSAPKQLTNKIVIAEMTADLKGLQSDVVGDISSASSSLQAIIGSSNITNGFRDAIISSGTPEALAAAAKVAAPNADINKLKAIAQDVVDISVPISITDNSGLAFAELEEASGELNKLLDNVVKSGFSIGNALNNVSLGSAASLGEAIKNSTLSDLKIESEFNKLKSEVFDNVNIDVLKGFSSISNGFGSIIEDTIESTFGESRATIESLAVKNGIRVNISKSKLKEINSLLSKGQLDKAAKILQKNSDLTIEEIKDGLSKIDNRASKKTARPTNGVEVIANDLNKIAANWQGKNSSKGYWDSTSIKSPAELESELSAINREVTEVIIFSTGNSSVAFSSSQEFHEFMWDLEKLKSQEGFHYFIGTDGSLQRGKPVDLKFSESAIESLPNDHHERSIMLVFEGTKTGLATQDTENRIKDFFNSLFKIYPGIQVVGWRDIAPDQAANNPYFDFMSYIEAKYGKKTRFTDPSEQKPFTRKQLAQGYTV